VGEADEPVLVEAFITQGSVERFDIGVLIGLVRLDLPQRDAVAMRPGQHGLAGQFAAVVLEDHRRLAAACADLVESPL